MKLSSVTMDPVSPADAEAQLEQRLILAEKNLPAAFLGAGGVAILISLVLLGHTPEIGLIAWLSYMLGSIALRGVLARAGKKPGKGASQRKRLFVLGVLAAALGWPRSLPLSRFWIPKSIRQRLQSHWPALPLVAHPLSLLSSGQVKAFF